MSWYTAIDEILDPILAIVSLLVLIAIFQAVRK